MKKENKTSQKVLKEVIQYDCEGIKVVIEIDHTIGTVSLVHRNPNDYKPGFKPKEFVFANRGLEYMNGWQKILNAMKHAVGEATKLLEKDLAEENKFIENIINKQI